MDQDQEQELKKNQEAGTTGNPDSLADLRAEAQGDGGEATPEPERGAPEMPPTDPRLLTTFWRVQFGIIARRAGEHWRLTDDEAAQLGELSVPVVDKWLPAVMTKFGAELMLAGALVMVAVDKMGKGHAKETGNIDNPGAAGSGKDNAS